MHKVYRAENAYTSKANKADKDGQAVISRYFTKPEKQVARY